LGTPQTEETVYWQLEQKGYKPLVIPARYPNPSEFVKYRGYLLKKIQAQVEADADLIGHSTDKQRFSDFELAQSEASYGRSDFMLQFMMDTSLSDADKHPLKLSDLIIFNASENKAPMVLSWASDPDLYLKQYANLGFTGDRWYKPLFVDNEWKEFEGKVMFVDPSGRGVDQTAYAIVGSLNGYLYLLDCGGFKDGYTEEVLKALSNAAKDHKVNTIVVEPNYGGGMFNQLLIPVLHGIYKGCSVIDAEWSQGQKEKRIIDTLEPVMNRHKLIVSENVIQKEIEEANKDPKYCLFWQMTRLTADRGSLAHDDKIEAVAGAVNYWVKSMARDDVTEKEKLKERLKEQALKDWMNRVRARGSSGRETLRGTGNGGYHGHGR